MKPLIDLLRCSNQPIVSIWGKWGDSPKTIRLLIDQANILVPPNGAGQDILLSSIAKVLPVKLALARCRGERLFISKTDLPKRGGILADQGIWRSERRLNLEIKKAPTCLETGGARLFD